MTGYKEDVRFKEPYVDRENTLWRTASWTKSL